MKTQMELALGFSRHPASLMPASWGAPQSLRVRAAIRIPAGAKTFVSRANTA
jgi:hypothetical protein